MTAEQIEKDLRILEIQYHHGMPWVEYERKKRQLEQKISCDESQENGSNYLTKGKGGRIDEKGITGVY